MGHEHFDLLQFNNEPVLNQGMWEYLLQKTTN